MGRERESVGGPASPGARATKLTAARRPGLRCAGLHEIPHRRVDRVGLGAGQGAPAERNTVELRPREATRQRRERPPLLRRSIRAAQQQHGKVDRLGPAQLMAGCGRPPWGTVSGFGQQALPGVTRQGLQRDAGPEPGRKQPVHRQSGRPGIEDLQRLVVGLSPGRRHRGPAGGIGNQGVHHRVPPAPVPPTSPGNRRASSSAAGAAHEWTITTGRSRRRARMMAARSAAVVVKPAGGSSAPRWVVRPAAQGEDARSAGESVQLCGPEAEVGERSMHQ